MNVPKHLGVILDGNRRFAKRLMLKPWKGHEWGAKKIKEFLEWCRDLGIKEVTVYAFSIENFNRPKKEFDYLMKIFTKEFNAVAKDSEVHKNKVKFNFIGRIWMLPKKVQTAINNALQATKDYNNYVVNIALAYGGRAELVDAVKNIGRKIQEGILEPNKVDEELIKESLYLSKDVDLVIRTSGEKRTSGFLIWQSDYAEFYFCDKHWPELEKEDLTKAIQEYSERNRRFGK